LLINMPAAAAAAVVVAAAAAVVWWAWLPGHLSSMPNGGVASLAGTLLALKLTKQMSRL
jgi:hypothetical protein